MTKYNDIRDRIIEDIEDEYDIDLSSSVLDDSKIDQLLTSGMIKIDLYDDNLCKACYETIRDNYYSNDEGESTATLILRYHDSEVITHLEYKLEGRYNMVVEEGRGREAEDSIEIDELIYDLETEFGNQLESEELEELSNAEDLYDLSDFEDLVKQAFGVESLIEYYFVTLKRMKKLSAGTYESSELSIDLSGLV